MKLCNILVKLFCRGVEKIKLEPEKVLETKIKANETDWVVDTDIK